MDEDTAIINSNTRNERIKNFFVNNKKKIIIFLSLIILFLVISFGYLEYKKSKKLKISDEYN